MCIAPQFFYLSCWNPTPGYWAQGRNVRHSIRHSWATLHVLTPFRRQVRQRLSQSMCESMSTFPHWLIRVPVGHIHARNGWVSGGRKPGMSSKVILQMKGGVCTHTHKHKYTHTHICLTIFMINATPPLKDRIYLYISYPLDIKTPPHTQRERERKKWNHNELLIHTTTKWFCPSARKYFSAKGQTNKCFISHHHHVDSNHQLITLQDQ